MGIMGFHGIISLARRSLCVYVLYIDDTPAMASDSVVFVMKRIWMRV
jgi:hypothetical protein